MKKLILTILFTLALSASASAFFEIIGKSTVKNVEKCIDNSSKLLDKDENETRCVIKFQKKISKDITTGKASHVTWPSDISLRATVENTSNDIVITGLQIRYEFNGLYNDVFGTIKLTEEINGDPKIDKFAGYNQWLQPGETRDFNIPIQEYTSCEHVPNYQIYISSNTVFCDSNQTIKAKDLPKFYQNVEVNFPQKNFKYESKKLKDNWSWYISEVYGVYIK